MAQDADPSSSEQEVSREDRREAEAYELVSIEGNSSIESPLLANTKILAKYAVTQEILEILSNIESYKSEKTTVKPESSPAVEEKQ